MDKKQLQQRVTEQRRRVRRRLTIRGVLSLLVVLTFIRCAFMQRYENMFVCVLSLVLLAMPTLIEKQLAIDIPPMMEAIIYGFIYAAEILGEINWFYTVEPKRTIYLQAVAAVPGYRGVLLLHDGRRAVGIFRVHRRSGDAHGHAEGLCRARGQLGVAQPGRPECAGACAD